MARPARPATPATSLLPTASMLAPLPGVKVAGAEVVADMVGDEAVGPAGVVLLETGNGAAMVMVTGAKETGADVTTGAEVIRVVPAEDTVDDSISVVSEADGATEAEPLGLVQGMVSM